MTWFKPREFLPGRIAARHQTGNGRKRMDGGNIIAATKTCLTKAIEDEL
ncbi:hypothetical protein [Prevotella sp. CAG:255]|nr:hypothetical protein [Prevotella sp. CAG:255]